VRPTTPAPRVLVFLDPYRVPGPWDPQPVADAIERGRARSRENGVGAHFRLLGLDGSDDVNTVTTAALSARPWECVVIGGGVRGDLPLVVRRPRQSTGAAICAARCPPP
jgi:hypothetical protein